MSRTDTVYKRRRITGRTSEGPRWAHRSDWRGPREGPALRLVHGGNCICHICTRPTDTRPVAA
jgi:hypothetical protein